MKYSFNEGLPKGIQIRKELDLDKEDFSIQGYTYYWDGKNAFSGGYYVKAAQNFYEAYKIWLYSHGRSIHTCRAALYCLEALYEVLPNIYDPTEMLLKSIQDKRRVTQLCRDESNLHAQVTVKWQKYFDKKI